MTMTNPKFKSADLPNLPRVADSARRGFAPPGFVARDTCEHVIAERAAVVALLRAKAAGYRKGRTEAGNNAGGGCLAAMAEVIDAVASNIEIGGHRK